MSIVTSSIHNVNDSIIVLCRGFSGGYVKEYIQASNPAFAIGEYWDSLGYEGGNLSYNQGSLSNHQIVKFSYLVKTLIFKFSVVDLKINYNDGSSPLHSYNL